MWNRDREDVQLEDLNEFNLMIDWIEFKVLFFFLKKKNNLRVLSI